VNGGSGGRDVLVKTAFMFDWNEDMKRGRYGAMKSCLLVGMKTNVVLHLVRLAAGGVPAVILASFHRSPFDSCLKAGIEITMKWEEIGVR